MHAARTVPSAKPLSCVGASAVPNSCTERAHFAVAHFACPVRGRSRVGKANGSGLRPARWQALRARRAVAGGHGARRARRAHPTDCCPFRIAPTQGNKSAPPNRMEAPLIETYYVAALAAIFGAAVGAAAVAGRKAPGTPKAYVVTEVDVTGDMATFQRDYAAHAQATIEPFGGRYLVRGGRNIGVEGEPPKPRIVISVFDSFEQAQAWRNSPDYVKRSE